MADIIPCWNRAQNPAPSLWTCSISCLLDHRPSQIPSGSPARFGLHGTQHLSSIQRDGLNLNKRFRWTSLGRFDLFDGKPPWNLRINNDRAY